MTLSTAPTGIVLFLPLAKGHYLEMLPIAKMIRAQGHRQVIFVLESKQSGLLTDMHGDGFDVWRPDGTPAKASSSSVPDPVSQKRRGCPWKQRIFAAAPVLLQSLVMLRAERSRARTLLERHRNIRLIITVGDRHVGYETALLREVRKRNIPSLIVPFAMSFPEAAAEPRLRDPEFKKKYAVRGPWRCFLRILFPSWVYVFKGAPIFFHPPYIALAAWCLGMMPRRPWTIGGGAATKMAVESEAIRKMFIEQGAREEKMVVTGKPGLDAIAEQLGKQTPRETRQKLGIAPDARVILCTVPQLAEHDLLPWDRHKKEMQFLFETMAATGAHVLLSLHPRSDKAWYKPLADAAGAHIVDERIYGLLPACDVFVATYSSIVAQAIALHKPSVVVDFFELEYFLYARAPGVTVLRDRAAFLPTLKTLLNDPKAYDAAVRAQESRGTGWALLDGKNTERVLTLAEEIIRKHPNHRNKCKEGSPLPTGEG